MRRLIERLESLTEGWMQIKRLFPDVRSPLFHGISSGPRSASIVLRKEGLKQVEGARGGPAQVGVSLTRSFDAAREFGSYIVVLDRSELAGGKLSPMQYPGMPDEYEERYAGNIPFKKIRGLVLTRKAQRIEAREMQSKELPFPVVHLVNGSYERLV